MRLEKLAHNSETVKVIGKSQSWESNMPEGANDYSSAVNKVIAVCKDAEEGFRGAAVAVVGHLVALLVEIEEAELVVPAYLTAQHALDVGGDPSLVGRAFANQDDPAHGSLRRIASTFSATQRGSRACPGASFRAWPISLAHQATPTASSTSDSGRSSNASQ